MHQHLRRGLRGEASIRIVLAVALVAGLLGAFSLTRPTAAAPVTLTRSVAASSDDARYTEIPSFTSTETAVAVGTGNGTRINVSGYRFTNISIPRGATITSVEFSMVKSGTQVGRMAVTYAFQATGNAATFSSSSTPAQRTMTTTRSFQDNNVGRTNGQRYVLGNPTELAASLQQVVNRADWNSGNSVVLLAWGNASPAWARQTFRTFNSGSANAPSLKITYYTAGSTPTATNTTVPPTATRTPVPATATNTAVVPTATRTPTATSTPTGQPTTYAANVPWATQPSWTQPAGAPTPVAGQPCPVWVHDRYAAQGPDGRWYPTWHPNTDPQFGCVFGHEHGDDPTSAPALRGRKPLFGYASLMAGMNEAHTGFKVFRWDNIQSVNGPSHNGASYLAVLHQGTSGAGRFSIVHHDIEVHYYRPADGREVHVHMLAPFGTLKAGCGANDPNMELVVQQQSVPGARIIPTSRCYTLPSRPYEDWITALFVGVDAQGFYKAYLDPHFAVFNPNTYCVVQSNACTLAYSDVRDNTGADPAGTGSWYKGTKREAYINSVWIRNTGGSTSVWTDVYGKLVAPNSPGAIEQYLSAVFLEPQVNSTVFGANNDHDPDGSVHAPN